MYFSVLWAESALIWSLPCAKYKGGVVHITQHIQANESTKTAGHKRILYILSGGRTNIYCELAWPLFPKVHSLFVHSFVRSARPWVLELMNRSGSASLSQPRPGAWILCRWGHETQLDWTLAPIHVCAQRVGGGGHVERAGAGPCWKWAACERGGGGGGGGGHGWPWVRVRGRAWQREGSLLLRSLPPSFNLSLIGQSMTKRGFSTPLFIPLSISLSFFSSSPSLSLSLFLPLSISLSPPHIVALLS